MVTKSYEYTLLYRLYVQRNFVTKPARSEKLSIQVVEGKNYNLRGIPNTNYLDSLFLPPPPLSITYQLEGD